MVVHVSLPYDITCMPFSPMVVYVFLHYHIASKTLNIKPPVLRKQQSELVFISTPIKQNQ
jgi:hypothetical protein